MGKPTGFLEFNREDAKASSVKERIKNYNEFHTPLSHDEQKKQASRCMECGVPFCQSGMMIGSLCTRAVRSTTLSRSGTTSFIKTRGNRHTTD